MTLGENRHGKVYIVGAGPGAGDLITLRGLAALRKADAVFYDALVSATLLDEAPGKAERIFVGKRCGNHSINQADINRLMIDRVREGKTVVRLKGGDPFIFGRGGEEALACAQAGLEFEVVPGVSAALGAASYLGIPLTHRGVSSSVAFVAAHGAGCGDSPDLSWIGLARNVGTIVIFMGGSWLDRISAALIENGLPESTPVAVVSNATTDRQKSVLGSLGTIAGRAARAGLTTPTLIVVGEVVRMSEALNWFERQRQAACEPVSS
jgi:uroporphyrin-III C-methyltransferase